MLRERYDVKFPGQVFSGADSVESLAEIAKGKARVCLLTDAGVYESGIVHHPLALLASEGCQVTLIRDVPPEPSEGQIKELYRRFSGQAACDLMVAIGGGSVLDAAKILATAITNPPFARDLKNVSLIQNVPTKTVLIPTSAGTGSEATANAIILFPEEDLKVGIISPAFMSDYVILDPKLTIGLPPALTASTGLDALCHAIESYISLMNNPFSELFALRAIELICSNIDRAYQNGQDLEARGNMQLAAFYAGVCLTTSCTVAVHALSYPLGGKYHIPHGVSNAILLPHVMQANLDAVTDRFNSLAPLMLTNWEDIPLEERPQAVVDYLFDLVKRLGIPQSLTEVGVRPEDLDLLTDNALKVTRLLSKNPKKLSREEICGIYKALL